MSLESRLTAFSARVAAEFKTLRAAPPAAPAWAPSTPYVLGALVWQAGQLWRRKTAGTSTTSFDAAQWDPVPTEQNAWMGLATTVADPPGTVGFPLGSRTYYMRVRRCPANLTVSKIAVGVGAAVGNVSVAVHRNSGTGMAAVPSTQAATSGAVLCPAAAPYAEVALGSAVAVSPGDWLALSCDNILAAFAGISVQTSGAAGAMTVNDPLVRIGTGHPCPATPVLGTVAPAARAFQLIGVP